MNRTQRNVLGLTIGLALAGPALAVNFDFSGSNFYMKFLDGNYRMASSGAANTQGGSGDTASGTDQGQWAEFEMRIKATISPQVEAGLRLQSRSSAAYWTDYGGFGDQDVTATRASYMKARGIYAQLTPGYTWLDQARIGASDWGMFDPFTLGKLRYIDRDNVKGFYFKGPLYAGGSWEAARVSLPNYLQFNFGQGPVCCTTDDTQFQEALYIAQLKKDIGPARLTASYQFFDDHQLAPDNTNPYDGRSRDNFYKNRVFMLKGEGSPASGVDLRVAYYKSKNEVTPPAFGETWGNSPRSSIDDRAYKLDLDLSSLPVANLTLNLQYFNIGAGYYSNTAARRESDVLLTEGSESAWYRWGDPIWVGGAAKDYDQVASTPRCGLTSASGGSLCNGLLASANGLRDNDLMDFDEAPAESTLGWKGFTGVAHYDLASTPLSFEYSNISYNYNWTNYSPTGPLSNFFPLNQDRKTNIYVFKLNHVFPVWGGLDTQFKWKRVSDEDTGDATITTDDRQTKDNGYSVSVGNQLFSHLYGSLAYGHYKRDVTLGPDAFDNKKDIYSMRVSYNLPGFELGGLAQWIRGKGDPLQAGTQLDIKQYRMKIFSTVRF